MNWWNQPPQSSWVGNSVNAYLPHTFGFCWWTCKGLPPGLAEVETKILISDTIHKHLEAPNTTAKLLVADFSSPFSIWWCDPLVPALWPETPRLRPCWQHAGAFWQHRAVSKIGLLLVSSYILSAEFEWLPSGCRPCCLGCRRYKSYPSSLSGIPATLFCSVFINLFHFYTLKHAWRVPFNCPLETITLKWSSCVAQILLNQLYKPRVICVLITGKMKERRKADSWISNDIQTLWWIFNHVHRIFEMYLFYSGKLIPEIKNGQNNRWGGKVGFYPQQMSFSTEHI